MNAPKMPYSVEVESERTEVVKHYGVVRPGGAMGGTTYTDKDDAEEEAEQLNEAFAAGRASAMERVAELEAQNNALRVSASIDVLAREVIAHEVIANPSHRWCAPNSGCVVCDLAAALAREVKP